MHYPRSWFATLAVLTALAGLAAAGIHLLRPDDQSHTPAAADTFQADPRLATCQPTHTSLPEKILETLAT